MPTNCMVQNLQLGYYSKGINFIWHQTLRRHRTKDVPGAFIMSSITNDFVLILRKMFLFRSVSKTRISLKKDLVPFLKLDFISFYIISICLYPWYTLSDIFKFINKCSKTERIRFVEFWAKSNMKLEIYELFECNRITSTQSPVTQS